MQKTVVVLVERIKEHLKYKRRFKVSKKYKAHTDASLIGECKIGDRVISTFETKNKLLIVTKVNEKLEQWLKKIVKKNRKMLTELAKYD